MTREQLAQERTASAKRKRQRFAPVIRRVLEREAAEQTAAVKARRGGWPYTIKGRRA